MTPTKALTSVAAGSAVLVADFVKLGSAIAVVVGVLVAALVAYFTIRNLQRSYWRNLVDERDAELLDAKRLADQHLRERADFAEQQRELRHKLKNELAEAHKRVELERAKSDLSAVFSRMDALEQTLDQKILEAIHQQGEVLIQILGELRRRTV